MKDAAQRLGLDRTTLYRHVGMTKTEPEVLNGVSGLFSYGFQITVEEAFMKEVNLIKCGIDLSVRGIEQIPAVAAGCVAATPEVRP